MHRLVLATGLLTALLTSLSGCGSSTEKGCTSDADCTGGQVCCFNGGARPAGSPDKVCVAPMLNADGGPAGVAGPDGGATACGGSI